MRRLLEITQEIKKLNFNYNNFKKFKDKITYIIVDDIPVNTPPLKKTGDLIMLETNTKKFIVKRFFRYNDDDLIMISDIDEIPNPKKSPSLMSKINMLVFYKKIFNQN